MTGFHNFWTDRNYLQPSTHNVCKDNKAHHYNVIFDFIEQVIQPRMDSKCNQDSARKVVMDKLEKVEA